MSNNEVWIEHDGKGMPNINPVELVNVKFKNGRVFSNYTAYGWEWKHFGGEYDIVAYQTVNNTLVLFDTGIADYA